MTRRVLVVTSCTSRKTRSSQHELRPEDFERGAIHLRKREQSDLSAELVRAEEMYNGQQHVRLMRGVEAARRAEDLAVDVWIVSAGYGVVSGDRRIAPYQTSFNGMSRRRAGAWAERLGIPDDLRALLAEPFDLGLLLLGDDYLNACALNPEVELGGPVVAFCAPSTAAHLPIVPGLTAVPLSKADARRFRCGLVGLKGEVAGRLLASLELSDPVEPQNLIQRVLAGGAGTASAYRVPALF